MLDLDTFVKHLFDHLSVAKAGRIYVAFSGGVDSTVLLHLMCRVRQQHSCELYALHVDHGMNEHSAEWRRHCDTICRQLDVDLISTRLELDNRAESTARSARYHWMKEQMHAGSILLSAHHQQDRAETFLFNLMRGAGSAGLSSLRAVRPFYHSQLIRPLLPFSQIDILAYAKRQQLVWIDDPSNQNTRYARNDIRKNILPTLSNFRSDAIRNIARAAANLEHENGVLREVAISDLVEVREYPKHTLDHSHALSTDDLRSLSPARQANLVRFWLHSLDMHTPSQRFLTQLLAAIEQPPGPTAVLQEEGMQVRLYKGFMYVMPAAIGSASFEVINWQDVDRPLALFADRLQVGAKPKLRALLERQRQASLKLALREHLNAPLALQGHSLNLKKWMQDSGVPPWRRTSTPILTLVKANQNVVLAPVDQHHHNDWISTHCPG